MKQGPVWVRAIGWLGLALLFVLYSVSFNSYPVIEQEHSVLGDGDCANYARMIRDFSPTAEYGNPYEKDARGVGDIAQKHKIHHFLYLFVAAFLHFILSAFYKLFGLDPQQALYAVNAVVTCANILLLRALLRRHNPHGNPAWPFLLLYGFSLSSWIFASVPESWPFSATLILIFFNLLDRESVSPRVLAGFVGVMMLNNMILGSLVGFICLRRLKGRWGQRSAWLDGVSYFAVGGAVWLGSLTVLSLIEPGLRPDRYWHYTFWFRQFTLPGLPKWDPYVWKSMTSNLYINSVVSHQQDPQVPQEALLYTLQGNWLGRLATLAYVVLMGLAASRVFAAFRSARAAGEGALDWLADRSQGAIVWCGLMLFINLALFYPGGFLYSTAIVPLFAVVYMRYLNLSNLLDRLVLAVSLLAIVINNSVQIEYFRAVLTGM